MFFRGGGWGGLLLEFYGIRHLLFIQIGDFDIIF